MQLQTGHTVNEASTRGVRTEAVQIQAHLSTLLALQFFSHMQKLFCAGWSGAAVQKS